MKIAILGYGKMGKSIEELSKNRGHKIIAHLNSSPLAQDINEADVAIEFSTPQTAFDNTKLCIENNIPVISGTTGWLNRIKEIEDLCIQKKGAFLYSSNFSLGVNLFFEINRKVAQLMKNYLSYHVGIKEIHHIQKLDAPSGTAITLAETIIKEYPFEKWVLGKSDKTENELIIEAERIENVPGIHIVKYTSDLDQIELKHTAFSRQGFALGAIIAAEWIVDKTGVFSMQDVLNI